MTIAELLAYCDVAPEQSPLQAEAAISFNIKAPPHYLQQIKKGDATDPLLRQILPITAELEPDVDQVLFVNDPLEEVNFNPVPGLIHKYHGRVLLIANPSCAIHCRYCFRRHFNYQDNTLSTNEQQAVIRYIQEDSSIHEVILSGGDPLSSNDKHLAQLINRISSVDHVKTLRIHTRIPTTVPERITDDLLAVLNQTRLKVVMVLHVNHVQELSFAVKESIELLQSIGIRLLNQSVLLAGVNDSAKSLSNLFFALHELDIQAYYLHMLDKVSGAEHFLISDKQAVALYQELQATMPAYMLPKLAREEAMQANKTLLTTNLI
ncbi:MAG: EF-P beta-lysylation protein EpmB [Sinobacterium sp.]|nr:EF-P beta-lysylation protein EpmB [Sinobacterium sp.]